MRQLKITHNFTSREDKSTEKYLAEIGKIDQITQEEEVELSQRIKNGDTVAIEKLVKANLRFAVSVAKQYQHQGLPLGDLINEGNLGLIKAAHRFDDTRGFKFISYAVWWIRQMILQAIAEKSRMVRSPLNQITLNNQAKRLSTEYQQEFDREPTYEEIYRMVDEENTIKKKDKTSLDLVKMAMISGQKHISLHAPVGDEEDITLMSTLIQKDELSPDQELTILGLKYEIRKLLNKILPEKERTVIILYYGLDGDGKRSFEEIANVLTLTRERVRQIKVKAMRKLRVSSSNRILKTYLG